MAKQILNNGETGSSFRGKLNDNFTEVYDATTAGGIASTLEGAATTAPADLARIQALVSGYLAVPPSLIKSNRWAPAFSVSSGNLAVGQTIVAIVPGGIKQFSAGAITAISYTGGTDYVVTCNGTTLAIESYRTGSDVIGGFHYSLVSGINPNSIWDLNFRPSAPDPRGMAYAGPFWADIYLLGTEHITDGTSKSGVRIADGGAATKIPTVYGGNGTTTYATLNWWAFSEILSAYGKRLPTYPEFQALAYGVTEGASRGSDPVNTISDPARRSAIGVEQATGNMYQFGAEIHGYGEGSATFLSLTNGRGNVYATSCRVPAYGNAYDGGGSSGSRASYWAWPVANADPTFSARGVCGHYQP